MVLDEDGIVIFIGKSKELRKRVKSYRYLSPERTNNNAWNIAIEAADIEWEICKDVKQANLRAVYLIRRYRPRYNSYSSSTASYRYIGFNIKKDRLFFNVTGEKKTSKGYYWYGAFKHFGRFNRAYCALLRLSWAINTDADQLERIPLQLLKRQPPDTYEIIFHTKWTKDEIERWKYLLKRFLKGTAVTLLKEFQNNIRQKFKTSDSFLERLFNNDFRELDHFFETGPKINFQISKLYYLKDTLIDADELDDLIASLNKE